MSCFWNDLKVWLCVILGRMAYNVQFFLCNYLQNLKVYDTYSIVMKCCIVHSSLSTVLFLFVFLCKGTMHRKFIFLHLKECSTGQCKEKILLLTFNFSDTFLNESVTVFEIMPYTVIHYSLISPLIKSTLRSQ